MPNLSIKLYHRYLSIGNNTEYMCIGFHTIFSLRNPLRGLGMYTPQIREDNCIQNLLQPPTCTNSQPLSQLLLLLYALGQWAPPPTLAVHNSSSKPGHLTRYFPHPHLSYSHPSKPGVIKLFPKGPCSKHIKLWGLCGLQLWLFNTRRSPVLKTGAGLLVQKEWIYYIISQQVILKHLFIY